MPLYALGDQLPDVDPTAFVHPDAVVIGDVRIGRYASVWPGAVLRGDFGAITVGARTSIQDGTVLHTTARWPTEVGAGCVVGHLAHLEGCTVADHCLVGSGSVVLNGVRVGTDAVIAAGAVIREGTEVPPAHLAYGVPARLRAGDATKHRDWIEQAARAYVDNASRYQRELRRLDQVPAAARPDGGRRVAASPGVRQAVESASPAVRPTAEGASPEVRRTADGERRESR